ncbi:Hansenula MRAKII killer toxin-resistant protein 1 [Actinoplanes sp. CA-015351]|uniref:Hansenula MRAKII killer toxin-resistant protein 1 n=1 Tax=Actinoplanes sp. CA-015351 TaxID=3239897 RepID=UPI003D98C399
MAEKGWTSQAATAAGIAAGTGAAQLGLGYGLGVLVWPATAADAENIWLGSLGWATWITASATVLGAVIAGRLRPDRPGRWLGLWRFALATASALGALVSVALVALPARSAVRLDDLSPQLMAGGYALAGLLAGLIVAFWAVSSGPVAANLIGTAAGLWALAIAGVVAELVTGREFATYLTSWQFAEAASPVRYGGIYWPSALLTLAAAFVIGLIAAWPAARRGSTGLGTAISGAVGPLLVAFSFLILAPQLTQATGPLQSAYLIAPYAVLAGLAGSALTAALAQSAQARRNRPDLVPVTAPDSDWDNDVFTNPAETATTRGRAGTGTAGVSLTGAVASRAADQPGEAAGSGRKPTSPVSETPGRNPVAPRQPLRPEPKPVSTPPAPKPLGPPPSAGTPTGPAPTAPAKATGSAKAPGQATPSPVGKPATQDSPPYADPEIAAAARPSRNPAKRATGRKADNGKPDGGTPRSTITPPPANPTVARINPDDPSSK